MSADNKAIEALRDVQRAAWATGYETGRIDGAATERAVIAGFLRNTLDKHDAAETVRRLLAAIDPQPDPANKEPTS